jgi:hypothetical protein
MDPLTTLYPATPTGFHAQLRADVRVRDSGQGTRIELTFADGFSYRGRATSEMLRLGRRLNGPAQVTLDLRTLPSGQLHLPLAVVALAKRAVPIAHPSGTAWSATGLVTSRRGVLVLVPSGPARMAAELRYEVTDSALIEGLSAQQSVHLAGILEAGRLVATVVQPIPDLPLRARWATFRQWL